MKDRIKKVMESQHMTQQEFADFIHISPASLSSIFTGRTRPTIATVEAIKSSLPDVSTDWLLFGTGSMFLPTSSGSSAEGTGPESAAGTTASPIINKVSAASEPVLDFGADSFPSSAPLQGEGKGAVVSTRQNSSSAYLRGDLPMEQKAVKNIDIPQRTITEIRIFYSDQTWETFVPKK